MAKTVLLVIFLIIVAFFSGRTLMLASNLFSGKRADFFSSFSTGSLIIICLSFVSHFITVAGSSLLEDEKHLSGVIMVAFMTVSYFAFVALTVITGVKNKKSAAGAGSDAAAGRAADTEKAGGVSDGQVIAKNDADVKKADVKNTDKKDSGKKNSDKKYIGKKKADKKVVSAYGKVFFAVAAVLSCICFWMIISGSRLNSLGDETLETVVSFVDRGDMYAADPLTGMPYREGLPGKYKILCLPGMYAVMSAAFGTSPEVLVHNVMPGFWFMSGLFAMIALSGAIFREEKDELFKRSVFVAAGILFIYASDLSLYAQGFTILSSMWTGAAIRIWLLIPVLLFLLIERKYITALLPVICEALICRTVYGVGFLACIYAGWIVLYLIMGRVKCSKAS